MDFEKEIMARAAWIREVLEESGAKGIVFGSSGGKDSALVGILSRIATPNVTGIVMRHAVPREITRKTGITLSTLRRNSTSKRSKSILRRSRRLSSRR